MIQNLISKLNAKFPLFYYALSVLEIVAVICGFIYMATSSNLSTLSYFYYIADIIISVAFFGFGAFLLFKQDSAKFKVFFTMYVVYIVISNIFSLASVFAYPMGEYTPAVTIVYYILCMLSVLVMFTFAICYFLNKFYPNPLFMTIANFALIGAAVLEVISFVVILIGVIQGYIGWSSLTYSIESICFYFVLLLGINNKEVTD